MTNTDLVKLNESLEVIKYCNLVEGYNTAIHSPWAEQVDAFRNVLGFVPDVINIKEWNILYKHPEKREWDLLFLSNVMMYITLPQIALDNLLSTCKYLLFQDLIIRNRSEYILGTDGDIMRYSYKEFQSNLPGAYDLTSHQNRMLFFVPYTDDHKHLHFIALLKGNIK